MLGPSLPSFAAPPVPLLDTTRQLQTNPGLKEALHEAFARVLASGRFILGEEVTQFEALMAETLGVPYAVGVSSGTDALLLALMTAGVGPGDRVLCPSFTFFATAGVIARLGARPVFVDSCLGCFNVAPEALARAHDSTKGSCRAVLPVHLFGQLAAMAPITAWAREAGIVVIEDAAQAFGASVEATQAGSFGAMGCFSFFSSKNLGGLGDAGLVTTHDPALADKLTMLRVHGSRPKYVHHEIGGNFRIDALQAALLRAKAPYLPRQLAARRAHADRYDSAFTQSGRATWGICRCSTNDVATAERSGAALILPARAQGLHTFNQYVIRVTGGRRDAVRDVLGAHKIGCEVYYPIPLHKQPCFAPHIEASADLPNADRLASEVLALPIFPELRADEQERVIAAVLAATA